MAQADQTSISAWETAVRPAAGRCSFGPNADELMRDKFPFGPHESFDLEKTFSIENGQRKPDDPPFTLAFVVSQAMSFEAAQLTDKQTLAHSYILKNRSTMPHPQHQPEIFKGLPADQSGNLAFSVVAKPHIHVKNVQPKDKHETTVKKLGHFSSVCQQAARDQRSSSPPPKKPIMPSPRRKHVHIVDQDDSSAHPSEFGLPPKTEYCIACIVLLHHLGHKTSHSSRIFYSF